MRKLPRIKQFYDHLSKRYGKQNWWPAESALECIIGAILTQNTSWKNAEKAIQNLKSKKLLNTESLQDISTDELARTVRPSGYYNQKAKRIKNFINYFSENYGCSLEKMREKETDLLRSELLEISGIGPETADTILLYALGKPRFVIDRYTYRMLKRHGIVKKTVDYSEMQELMTGNLETDTELYNEYHALIVQLGKNHCRKRANCSGCPLEYDLLK